MCCLFQDWEDGLCETDVDGSFLHDNWNKDLRLFADGEDGGQQLLQVFTYFYAILTNLCFKLLYSINQLSISCLT